MAGPNRLCDGVTYEVLSRVGDALTVRFKNNRQHPVIIVVGRSLALAISPGQTADRIVQYGDTAEVIELEGVEVVRDTLDGDELPRALFGKVKDKKAVDHYKPNTLCSSVLIRG